MDRYDERDTMFARMSYLPGSSVYNDYYKMHPELKEIDDRLRDMPQLASKDSPTYEPLDAAIINSSFEFLSYFRNISEMKPEKEPILLDKAKITQKIKELA